MKTLAARINQNLGADQAIYDEDDDRIQYVMYYIRTCH